MPAKKTVKSRAVKPGTAKSRPAKRRSRVYSISLPPDLAARAEAIAKAESRTMSEVFRDAFRVCLRDRDRVRNMFDEIREYVKTLPPTPYTEEDVPRLIKEVRAEMRAQEERKMRKAG
ncbi:MAG TPA: ribbon-helix-helix protein, CopG family [Acidobacteriaceae bacterium]|jgi:predicted DNA-binding protein|nr:ribbon-helix-helix protein, CopG family [Acidobacteriaceae bacterium]